ncbi:hypothetical protein [Streptomyces sp. NPDC093261]|uniref:hypothetical protein n=1 Tax=Streptomyces sp. NPDC093261 TaxID=3366037 RepID=UPI003810E583
MTSSPRWRYALASAASAAVLVAAPLMGAQTAYAQYPPPPPTLTLDKTTVRVGETVTHHATGFAPRQIVTVLLESREIVLGRFQAHDDGTVDGTVTIPSRVRPGLHVFRLTARNPHRSASTRIRVLPALGRPGDDHPGGGHGRHAAWERPEHRAGLAATGSEKALAVGGTAAGLIAAGGGTMLAVRRRRSS